MNQIIQKIAMVLFALLTVNSCQPKSKNINNDQISISWELEQNKISPNQFHQAKFTLTNNGNPALKPGWEIYFNTIFLSVNPQVLDSLVSIEHLSGDFFRIKPKDGFPVLEKGETHSFSYSSDNFLLKNSHTPSGLYIVFGDSEEGHPIEDFKASRIEIQDQLTAVAGSNFPIPDPAYLFEKNQNLSLLSQKDFSPIIPTPKSYNWGVGEVVLSETISIYADAGFEMEAKFLKERLSTNFKGKIEISSSKDASFLILKDPSKVSSEAYALNIGEKIEIRSGNPKGAFYGIQSLLAMLPLSSFTSPTDKLELPKISIEDEPRFEYRSFFLDVARNFQSKKAILKILDLMAFYKLNVFHFNLANDEGWRIEIPGLPELTEVGSKRGHSKDESQFLWPYYASGPDKDKSPNGTGFYSTEDFKEILRYAKERHIEVIPEIGAPGHSRAAIIAMRKRYHDKMKSGDKEGALEYLLEDFEDQSEYLSAQNFRGNTICICQESAFTFYEKVVDEILAMYEEADVWISTFHTGGDEVPKGAWTNSPVCEKFIAETEGVNTRNDLQNYFYTRVSKMFEERGIQTAGWEEIGQIDIHENGKEVIRPNPVFANKGFRAYAWNAVAGWGGEDMAYQLANAGYEVIICNSSNFYFDLAYNVDPDEPGHQWSGFVDTKTAWRTVPLNNFISNETDMYGNPIDAESLAKGKAKMTAEGTKNIKGVSGQLWTETIKGQEMMEYYLLPKMLGYVERAWSQDPEWTAIADPEKRKIEMEKEWNKFANALGQKEIPRLEYLFGGFNVRLPKAGATVKEGKIFANVDTPGLTIRYTVNGSEPTIQSEIYSEPIPFKGNVKLQVFSPQGKSGGISGIK
ncbi:carbohydate-binding domain-containing protein [Aquiflexum sp. LQ15W]|uniref:family 20 glycosylhydrolase n=1 Tax=Cognataquiflexum nitidum TaxID=2922272 RepID=UPI001F147355|nr:family 20 glycosylhydrolase [Cognataquiflexum nitidum]MCH6198354.1 carbohydate-binding domain-containing protein [Cognataquiflexum nitidum]